MKKLKEKGNISIILAILITGLLGFTSYVVDIGLVYAEKIKLTNAIDSAALAAVQELPGSDAFARAIAIDYLSKNNVLQSEVVITIASDHKSIQIVGVKNVKHLFAQIIGINSNNINASTKAIVAPIKSVSSGIRPFAVEIFPFSYGGIVTLKEGGGDGYNGNYGAVALGGTGANVFKNNAIYGYNGTISAGDYIDTETGNMSGATNAIINYINSEQSTFNNFPKNSIRLWTIPLVNTLQVNGRSQVLVAGFGQFYVESVGNNSGKMEMVGRFIKYVRNGTVDTTLNDTGAYGSKLSK